MALRQTDLSVGLWSGHSVEGRSDQGESEPLIPEQPTWDSARPGQ